MATQAPTLHPTEFRPLLNMCFRSAASCNNILIELGKLFDYSTFFHQLGTRYGTDRIPLYKTPREKLVSAPC